MDYIRITDWDKWQSYRKDRGQPPWIKLHRRLMRNPKWVFLSDAERGQLAAIWLLAADHDGVIPASPEVIQKLCFMTDPPNLRKFHELEFLESNGCHVDAKVTPTGCQDDAPKAETETETDKIRKENISGLGQFLNVVLSESELGKLTQQFGRQGSQERIEALSSYMASKGKRYKSHYATILTWARKDGHGRSTRHAGIQEWLSKTQEEGDDGKEEAR